MLAKRRQIILFIVAGFALGAFAGWAASYEIGLYRHPSAVTQIRVNLPNYDLINPLLFSENAKSDSPYAQGADTAINSAVSSVKADPSVESVSVYFRDLNSGQWTGVDEDVLYKPSSMLKVLTMMAAFKVAEQDPAILSEEL